MCELNAALTVSDYRRNRRRTAKNMEGNKKFRCEIQILPADFWPVTDGFKNNNNIFFISIGESIGNSALYIPAPAASIHFFCSSIFHLKNLIFLLSILQGFHLESLARFVVVNLHHIKRYVFFSILFYFIFSCFYFCYFVFLVFFFLM